MPWRRGGTSPRPKGPRAHADDPGRLTSGERALLRSARERHGYTVEQLAEAMDVRPRYVSALERGELEAELSLPYVRNLVAHYALHVGLDPGAFLVGDDDTEPSFDAAWTAHDAPSDGRFRRVGRHLVVAVVTVALLAAGFYAAMQVGVLPGAADDGPRPAVSPSTVPSTGATSTAVPPTAATPTTVLQALSSYSTTTSLAPMGQAGTDSGADPDAAPDFGGTSTGDGDAGAADVGEAPAPFLVRFRPMDEVWMEVTDETEGTILYSGTRRMDDVLELRQVGPVLVVVGRPEAVKVSIDRVRVQTPSSQRWRVTKQGIESLD